jgi:hypothetical protein
LAIWVIMMVAMMFPTASPMILTFHRVQAAKRQRSDAFVSTWVFVAAYILAWTLAGAAAYVGALANEIIAARTALSPATAARIGGVVLVAAGLYQLTPLKDLCLSKCRTPMTFVTTSWRDGAAGALHMGLLHGAYCLGWCWLLFVVILFPLGIMNIGADGSCHFHYIRRENAALAPARVSRCGFRTCAAALANLYDLLRNDLHYGIVHRVSPSGDNAEVRIEIAAVRRVSRKSRAGQSSRVRRVKKSSIRCSASHSAWQRRRSLSRPVAVW